jgi:hypothetical protein
MNSARPAEHTENTLPCNVKRHEVSPDGMPSRFTEHEIKDFIRKADELHAKLPTLEDYLLLEVFLSENRDRLNRREPNSARKLTEQVMARWRKETNVKEALERGNPMD